MKVNHDSKKLYYALLSKSGTLLADWDITGRVKVYLSEEDALKAHNTHAKSIGIASVRIDRVKPIDIKPDLRTELRNIIIDAYDAYDSDTQDLMTETALDKLVYLLKREERKVEYEVLREIGNNIEQMAYDEIENRNNTTFVENEAEHEVRIELLKYMRQKLNHIANDRKKMYHDGSGNRWGKT